MGTAIVRPVAFTAPSRRRIRILAGRHTPDMAPDFFPFSNFNWRSDSISGRVKGLRSLKGTSTGPTENSGHPFNPGRQQVHAILGLFAVACFAGRLLAGPAQRPEDARVHAGEGVQAAQRGNLKTAEAELRQAVEMDPRNPAYLGTLGAILGTEQELEESN